MAAADAVGFEEEVDGRVELPAVEGDREALFEANDDLFALDLDIVAPECRAHDGDDDFDGRREMLQILGLMGCAKDVGVGGVGFLRRHFVGEAGALHEGRHLGAAA